MPDSTFTEGQKALVNLASQAAMKDVAAIEELQALAGEPVTVDGLYGPQTAGVIRYLGIEPPPTRSGRVDVYEPAAGSGINVIMEAGIPFDLCKLRSALVAAHRVGNLDTPIEGAPWAWDDTMSLALTEAVSAWDDSFEVEVYADVAIVMPGIRTGMLQSETLAMWEYLRSNVMAAPFSQGLDSCAALRASVPVAEEETPAPPPPEVPVEEVTEPIAVENPAPAPSPLPVRLVQNEVVAGARTETPSLPPPVAAGTYRFDIDRLQAALLRFYLSVDIPDVAAMITLGDPFRGGTLDATANYVFAFLPEGEIESLRWNSYNTARVVDLYSDGSVNLGLVLQDMQTKIEHNDPLTLPPDMTEYGKLEEPEVPVEVGPPAQAAVVPVNAGFPTWALVVGGVLIVGGLFFMGKGK